MRSGRSSPGHRVSSSPDASRARNGKMPGTGPGRVRDLEVRATDIEGQPARGTARRHQEVALSPVRIEPSGVEPRRRATPGQSSRNRSGSSVKPPSPDSDGQVEPGPARSSRVEPEPGQADERGRGPRGLISITSTVPVLFVEQEVDPDEVLGSSSPGIDSIACRDQGPTDCASGNRPEPAGIVASSIRRSCPSSHPAR